MRKFLVALSFFSRIKLNLKDVSEDEFYNSMTLMPMVGVVIGALLWLVAWLVSFINVPVIGAVILILAYLWITGGLHLDGVADTIDGLMSARDRKRVLEIMKDSRLGSFGAIALIILFLANFAAYDTLLAATPCLIFLAPFAGRFCGLFNCCFSTYAEGGGGLGKRIVEMTKPWHIIVYFLLFAAVGILCFGWVTLIALGVSLIIALWIKRTVEVGIGGMTGDTIGFSNEVCQVTYLLAAGIVAVNWPMLCGGLLWQWI